MFNWLHKLWQSILSKFEEQNTALEIEGQTETAIPNSYQESSVSTPPLETPKPILVRGKLWVDTSEDRWELPQKPEELHNLSVDDLIKQLAQTGITGTRRSAAERLGQLGDDAIPAISALVIAAIDIDKTVRKASLNALNEIDPAWPQNEEAQKVFPDLIAALKNWSSDVTKAAIKLLNLIGLPAVPNFADVLLNGEDTPEKIYVIRALARLGPHAVSAVPGLTRALGSRTLQVRIAAAQALANIGILAKEAIPTLIVGLTDSYPGGRRAMAACLAHMGSAAEPATPALLPLLSDQDKGVRKVAATALEKIGPATVPALIKVIQSPNTQKLKEQIDSMIKSSQWYIQSKHNTFIAENLIVVRYSTWAAYYIIEEWESLRAAQDAALHILGSFGSDAATAIETIAHMLNIPNLNTKLAASQALGQIGPQAKSTVPDLIQILTDKNKSIRESAANALENIDPDWSSDPAVTIMIANLANQLSNAKDSAEIAIHTLTIIGPVAVPTLIDILASGNRIAQENAATTLGQIGVGAKSAVPALNKAILDSHPWVQDKATKALAKINVPSTDLPQKE